MYQKRLMPFLSVLLTSILSPKLILSQNTKAPNQSVQIEFGPTFTGNGDLLGRLLNIEYGLGLTKKIGVGVGCHLGSFPGGNFNGYYKEEHKIRGLDLNGYFFPFSKSKALNGLFLSPGAHLRRWNSFYQTGESNGFTSSGSPIEPNSIATETATRLGYTLLIGYRFTLKDKFTGHVRMGVQNDFEGNIVSAVRFGLGYRF
jgi:hypothetical protein